MDEVTDGTNPPKKGKEGGYDYANMTLTLRECPKCGRHGQVVVMQGELVIQTIPVIYRDDARWCNAELVRHGGQEQVDFLAQVTEATYLRDEQSAVEPLTSGVVLFTSGGAMLIQVLRAARSARSRAPNSVPSDLTGAVLKLERCSCRKHGMVVLELPDGRTMDVAAPKTKLEACQELERLLLSYRTFPEQAAFVQAVREAEWLPGPMPVQE